MNLPAYIEKTGDSAFAKLVGCNERVAKSWRLRERIPSKKWADIIVAAIKGMTYEDIYAVQRKDAA